MKKQRKQGTLERAEERYPRGQAASNLGQQAAVYREGLQRVYSALAHDARRDFTVLPSIERQPPVKTVNAEPLGMMQNRI